MAGVMESRENGDLLFKPGSWLKCAVILLGLLVFLALASVITTFGFWDASLPSGEFRLTIRDADGKPVKGAILRIYRGGTREIAIHYPLENKEGGRAFVSDEKGRITALRKSDWRFGGNVWHLFWLIPMGDKVPEYDCEITAEAFKPLKFSARDLSRSPHQSHEDFPKTKIKIAGEEVILRIYEHTYTLGR
jgi:hypothetical protein